MQKASELVQQQIAQTHSQPGDPTKRKASIAVIREAFRHLNNAYGASFAPMKRRAGESSADYERRVHDTLDTWAGALGHLTPAEIATGVTRCIREMKFAERITPADIVSRARLEPEDMGLPSPRAAYLEAARQMTRDETDRQWSSPVVHAAAISVAAQDWRTQPEQVTWAQFERAYAIACRRYQAGERIDLPPPPALPQQPTYRRADPRVVAQLSAETADRCRASPRLRAALLRLARTAAEQMQQGEGGR